MINSEWIGILLRTKTDQIHGLRNKNIKKLVKSLHNNKNITIFALIINKRT